MISCYPYKKRLFSKATLLKFSSTFLLGIPQPNFGHNGLRVIVVKFVLSKTNWNLLRMYTRDIVRPFGLSFLYRGGYDKD